MEEQRVPDRSNYSIQIRYKLKLYLCYNLKKIEFQIEILHRKGEPIPEGWALDSTGSNTTDTYKALNGGILMPLGGTEMNSGYKGYGLAMLVEIFSGVLSGK